MSQSSPYPANADSTASEQRSGRTPRQAARADLPRFLPQPHPSGARQRCLALRCGGQQVPRRLQQCRLGRALPSARRRGACRPGRHAQHAHALPQRDHPRLRGKTARHVPADLGHAMFTCTGSEANDLAIRIAQHSSGGTGVIITDFAYHGATISTAQLSPAAVGAKGVPAHHSHRGSAGHVPRPWPGRT